MPRRPSPALSPGWIRFAVLAVVALVVSVAGSAAATTLVTGAQIKDGSVTGRNVRAHTITSGDIQDHSLRPRDFTGGSVTGATGTDGAGGPNGPVGPTGRSGLEYDITSRTIDPNSYLTWSVRCVTPGTVALAGGDTTDRPNETRLEDSAPDDDGAGWVITASNDSLAGQLTVDGWVVCAYPR